MLIKNEDEYDRNDIVVSGISGAFPNSENVEEFQKNLLEGNCMISQCDRWNSTTKVGLLKTIDRFDHTFFHITRQQAESMPISSRLLLEKTFEAILDAGYNPQQLNGKNIAVICGLWDSCDEGDPVWNRDFEDTTMTMIHTMKANRISFWLNVHGPSFAVNSGCSASLYAMDAAVGLIRSGQCDGAIVCSSNLCFSQTKYQKHSPLLNKTGSTSPYNADVDGYTRAEAVAVVFLQKRADARRIYANVIHTKTKCDGFKNEGITSPSIAQQKELYKQFYDEINLDPNSVSYIETHATATQVGDLMEATSIEEIFCTRRKTPLKIGSVKSNMGHGEASSGLCSLIKMIISFETGTIPAHVGYENPNPKIKGLLNGHLEVVTKPTPLAGKYFAVNSFGVGGANGHILLTAHDKPKKLTTHADNRIPLLVTVSGRTEEAIDYLLDDVMKKYHDMEYIRLIHEIFSENISGHLQRGFIIIQDDGKEYKRSKNTILSEKRPIWFVYSGMGSQWPAMGESLMKIPTFAASIRKSHQILQEKGLDLIDIITKNDPRVFDNILNTFVGIAAIQIALTDVLIALDIKPDGIIGHSVGELGCAYADECFTAEQTILAAYYRGLVSSETEEIRGKMAAIGEGYTVMKNLVPDQIDIACHNGPTSCTISGPSKAIEHYIELLQRKNIFVREVNTSNIAYHSRYIVPAAPKFRQYLQTIIPEPKLRSKKWICTSELKDHWDTDEVKYSSAEYHTNNLLNPVYFEEGCQCIPEDGVLIEIAPHGLLNAILKRSLPPTVLNIPLTLKNHQNQVEFLLNALGQVYESGYVPKLSNLYPPVEFPVSRSTPMISPSIKWNHDEQWSIGKLVTDVPVSGSQNILINPQSDEYRFLKDHNINGISVYPGLGYLAMVWDTVATMQKKKRTQVSIVFENVRFERVTQIPEKGTINFNVAVHVLTNNFEVTENGAVVATGLVRVPDNIRKEFVEVAEVEIADLSTLHNEDFYKEMRLRGLCYKNTFKKVICANFKGTYGKVSWDNNFITFMDAMAQISLLRIDTRELLMPIFVRKIVIDVEKHYHLLRTLHSENPEFTINFHPYLNLICCKSIQMTGWKLRTVAKRQDREDPVLETCQFVPYINHEEMELAAAVRTSVHIALENLPTIKIKTIELLCAKSTSDDIRLISSVIAIDILKDLPYIQAKANILTDLKHLSNELDKVEGVELIDILPTDKSGSLIFISNIRNHIENLQNILDSIRDDGFVITRESTTEDSLVENLGFIICFKCAINSGDKILLLRKVHVPRSIPNITLIKIENNDYSWISKLQCTLKALAAKKDEVLVLYAEKESASGILGFFNSLRVEEKRINMRCFFVVDENAPTFSLENSFYKKQFDKNLLHNVCKKGQWGSYRHLSFEPVENYEVTRTVCQLEKPGDFSSLRWIESSLDPTTKSEGKSFADVYYSGLNFRDIMLGLRKLSNIDSFYYSRLFKNCPGFEFSGRDESGDRIMGIVRHSGIASIVETIPNFTWNVPQNMTLEEAASIPIVYITVIYAFFFKIRLKKGASVLIHAGSGGVGQAAINICLRYNCTIFTTVGSQDKVEFIKKIYPQIPQTHICNSRDTTFETIIMQKTNGRGVDVVLNSLSNEKLQASVRCIARGGHFLEIGKSDTEVGHFLDEISFHSVQLDYIIWTQDEVALKLRKKFQEMLDQGIIKPITRIVFQTDEIETAFRYMASAKHIGKILIKLRDEEKERVTVPKALKFKVKPFVICHKDKSYVIVGGLGGFGLELADWLVLRGARNIVLNSRSGIKNGYQMYRINLWRSYGVNVEVSTEDITKRTQVEILLHKAAALGPIAGVFNLAALFKDKPFLQQTADTFQLAAGPKSIATIHLDQLTRKLCPELEYFVIFSSVSNRGNPSLTNYTFANCIMEMICETRKADNLPALAIQWGAIGEVGVVAEIVGDNQSSIIGGTSQQKIESCLKTLNIFMKQSNPIVSSIIVASKHRAETDVIQVVANVLGITDMNTISASWTLPQLGMDSILAMELRQILESEFNFFFTPEDLRKLTFAKLHQLKNEKINSSKLDEDEYERMMKQLILRIPFKTDKINAEEPLDENPTAFIFPGIEGTAAIMEPLAKNLPIQTLCFQYHDLKSASVLLTELRDYFAQLISEKIAPHQDFCIVGYSLGGLLAIEVASVLEENGRKGCVWLIDTSPNYVITKTKQCTNKKSWLIGKNAQSNAYNTRFSKIQDENFIQRRINLMSKQILNYEFCHTRLESPCTLIRSTENLFNSDNSCGLTNIFKNPIQIHQIDDADHYTILKNLKTAKIIMDNSIWNKNWPNFCHSK